jgi:hypothetical protein
MTYLVVLAAIALVPLLIILLLRVNAAIALMSLALGSVLVTYTSSDVKAVFGGFSSGSSFNKYNWIQLTLLVLPFILTILFTRGSVKGSKQLFNALPALASGLLLAIMVIPLLPKDVQQQIHHLAAWRQLDNLQTAVVLGGAAFSLLFLLVSHRKKHDEDGGKKHGKH